MSDRNLTTNPESAFVEALKQAKGNPETPEGVAWAMTRLLFAAASKVPTPDEFLDMFAVCLRAAEGERQTRNFTTH